MRVMIKQILKNTPNVGEIHEAVDGVEAVQKYKENKPDLVTMDIDMPNMNGLDASKQIKLFDSKAKIVMVTSSDRPDTREEAERIGVIGWIGKPFNREEIKKAVDALSK